MASLSPEEELEEVTGFPGRVEDLEARTNLPGSGDPVSGANLPGGADPGTNLRNPGSVKSMAPGIRISDFGPARSQI